MTMTTEGFVNLMEAVMEQARKDLTDKDELVRKDAEEFISKMKNAFAN